ncbi:hypothetical protein SARC_04180 [Sphaeroforma arctica JP610]|uniref:Uncharacterized protein n=1 Tax=Sphaeroforma arctica JP610 TaxID=667725 RepID=A0A0L0G3F2_9EUKA|nr:hypothetical protein SARC_04180 [Sphaeroforma arctica JP610]KNC83575.1 hypothetical protein SARC_04180 [Sphaeroforma arctica JP610]|eukprot:XP_014157477.1 hypothetical protein SARC_04180 [Sphaeroforma arctica JP610]
MSQSMKRDEVGVFKDPTYVTPEKPRNWDRNAEEFGCMVNGPLNALSQSPSGNQLVVAGRDVLQIIDLSRDECHPSQNLRVMRKHLNYSSYDVDWHPHPSCGNWIATAASNGAIVLWDLNLADVKKTARIIKEHGRSVHRVRFNALEHHMLLSGSQDGSMKLWDLRTKNNHIHSFEGRAESVRDVGFNPHNGTTFAAAFENGSVQVWDIRMPTTWESRIAAHQGPTFCINWHPEDRSVLASGGRDRVIKIWRTGGSHRAANSGGECLASVQTIASVCRVHWRPKHRYQIASCALVTDNSIHVWDLRRPFIPTASFTRNSDLVTGMEWHVNGEGNSLVSVSKDKQMLVHHYTKVSFKWCSWRYITPRTPTRLCLYAGQAERPANHVPSTSLAWRTDDNVCVVYGKVSIEPDISPEPVAMATDALSAASKGYFNRSMNTMANMGSSRGILRAETENKLITIPTPTPYEVNPLIKTHMLNEPEGGSTLDDDGDRDGGTFAPVPVSVSAHTHAPPSGKKQGPGRDREPFRAGMDPFTYMARYYLLSLPNETPPEPPESTAPLPGVSESPHTGSNSGPHPHTLGNRPGKPTGISTKTTDTAADTAPSHPGQAPESLAALTSVTDLCHHNAHVALACGEIATANTWQILAMMLSVLGSPLRTGNGGVHGAGGPGGGNEGGLEREREMRERERPRVRDKLLYFDDGPGDDRDRDLLRQNSGHSSKSPALQSDLGSSNQTEGLLVGSTLEALSQSPSRSSHLCKILTQCGGGGGQGPVHRTQKLPSDTAEMFGISSQRQSEAPHLSTQLSGGDQTRAASQQQQRAHTLSLPGPSAKRILSLGSKLNNSTRTGVGGMVTHLTSSPIPRGNHGNEQLGEMIGGGSPQGRNISPRSAEQQVRQAHQQFSRDRSGIFSYGSVYSERYKPVPREVDLHSTSSSDGHSTDSSSNSDNDTDEGNDLNLAQDIFDLTSPLASVSLSSQESFLIGYESWVKTTADTARSANPGPAATLDAHGRDPTWTSQSRKTQTSPWATPAIVADVLSFSADQATYTHSSKHTKDLQAYLIKSCPPSLSTYTHPQGDVQFCCTLVQVLGCHVESLPRSFTQQMFEEWFSAYIDILHRRSEFALANVLIKQSIVPAINEINQYMPEAAVRQRTRLQALSLETQQLVQPLSPSGGRPVLVVPGVWPWRTLAAHERLVYQTGVMPYGMWPPVHVPVENI